MTQEEYEMKVIAHITTSIDDARLIRTRNIHQDYFVHVAKGDKGSITRLLFKAAMQYFLENDRLLTPDGVEIWSKRQGWSMKRGDVGSRLVSLLVRCQGLAIDKESFPALLDAFRDRMMARLLQDLGALVRDTVKDKNASVAFEDAWNFLSAKRVEYADETAPTRLFSVSESFPELWTDYVDRRDHPDRYKGIKVGWNELDEATNGYKRQTLNLVIGEVNKGKSTMLLNMASGVHRSGKNVLFFSFEMPLFQCKARYVASKLSLPYDGFVHGSLKPEEEAKLKSWYDDNNGDSQFRKIELQNGAYFVFVDQPDDTSPSFVEQTVRQYRQLYGPPDAIFIDYLNNMKCDISKSAQWWEHTGEAAKGLRRIARIYDLVAFSAQQINREGLKFARKKIEDDPLNAQIFPEHIEGWKEVINTCDSAIGFNPDIDNHRMYVYRIKGRDWYTDAFQLTYHPTMSQIINLDGDDIEMGNPNFRNSPSAMMYDELRSTADQAEAADFDIDDARDKSFDAFEH